MNRIIKIMDWDMISDMAALLRFHQCERGDGKPLCCCATLVAIFIFAGISSVSEVWQATYQSGAELIYYLCASESLSFRVRQTIPAKLGNGQHSALQQRAI